MRKSVPVVILFSQEPACGPPRAARGKLARRGLIKATIFPFGAGSAGRCGAAHGV